MKRPHLFEFEDFRWFPSFLRNYMTDFLQYISNRFDIYKAVTPLLEEVLDKTQSNTVIDLASGGGGGLVRLSERLREKRPDLTILLTDFYPNIVAFEQTKRRAPGFEYQTESVDAMHVPTDLKGVRTQFLSLHHFHPDQAVQIIQNAVDANSAIVFFESQERNVPSVLAMLFSPINVLWMTPFIRPFSAGRLIFTYLIPLVPLFIMIDGVLSALRTYTVPEMEELVHRVKGNERYDWKIGKQKSGPVYIPYLIGVPKTISD